MVTHALRWSLPRPTSGAGNGKPIVELSMPLRGSAVICAAAQCMRRMWRLRCEEGTHQSGRTNEIWIVPVAAAYEDTVRVRCGRNWQVTIWCAWASKDPITVVRWESPKFHDRQNPGSRRVAFCSDDSCGSSARRAADFGRCVCRGAAAGHERWFCFYEHASGRCARS